MIVDQGEIAAYCDKEYSLEVQRIHECLESWIKETTGHGWESTSYSESLDGTGTTQIHLAHYPVSAITEISPTAPGIKIKNTSTDARNAYVAVDSDSLDLVVAEGANVMAESEAFSTYTTLATMVAQINTEAKGWEASLYDSDYGSYAVGCLLPAKNLHCGAWNGIAPSDSYLQILGKPLSGYTVDAEIGRVYYPKGFTRGMRNYMAKYSAYATGQQAIIGAVLNGVKYLITEYEEDTEGVKQYRTVDLSVSFEDILPGLVLDVVERHSKVM